MCLSNGISFKFFMMLQSKNLVTKSRKVRAAENWQPTNWNATTPQSELFALLLVFTLDQNCLWTPQNEATQTRGEKPKQEESGKWKGRTEPEGPTPMAAGQARRWIRSSPPHNWHAFALKIFARGFSNILPCARARLRYFSANLFPAALHRVLHFRLARFYQIGT